MTKICIHCYISGRVQGVGFRHYTKKQAIKYEVKGWVRNLTDGRVEVLVGGEMSNVNEFLSWLHLGPASAEVAEVVSTQEPWQAFTEFSIISPIS